MKKHALCLRFLLVVWAIVLGASVVLPGKAGAHRVNVFAWVEGDTVSVECQYPDGTKVHAGVIRVLDPAGKELLNGKTNDQGEFSFKIPQPTALKIVLEAGMGHRAEWNIAADELSGAGKSSGAAAPAAAPPTPASEASPQASAAPAPVGHPLPADIEQAVEKALDKKLAPVLRTLAEMHEQKVRPTDVLGGIGYIIGLVGIAAYFKRKP
jgi:nickel transport protein